MSEERKGSKPIRSGTGYKHPSAELNQSRAERYKHLSVISSQARLDAIRRQRPVRHNAPFDVRRSKTLKADLERHWIQTSIRRIKPSRAEGTNTYPQLQVKA